MGIFEGQSCGLPQRIARQARQRTGGEFRISSGGQPDPTATRVRDPGLPARRLLFLLHPRAEATIDQRCAVS